ncbi:MAG: shikimate kinase [Clostridia bacterium]|nr:shikimate kinase [Clostridia bacterium]
MNIVLCGMMGCGKSTVAVELNLITGMPVTDTDAEIVSRYGRIADIFANYGEGRFREIETAVTAELSMRDGCIIATGGGLVLREENVSYLKKNGKIVFLRTQADTLIKRVQGDTERPLLQGGAEKRIRELLPVRTPKYFKAADLVIDTDKLSAKEVAQKICDFYSLSDK